MTGVAAGGPLESVHPEVVRVKCGILRPNIRSEMENQKYSKPMVQSWLIGKNEHVTKCMFKRTE